MKTVQEHETEAKEGKRRVVYCTPRGQLITGVACPTCGFELCINTLNPYAGIGFNPDTGLPDCACVCTHCGKTNYLSNNFDLRNSQTEATIEAVNAATERITKAIHRAAEDIINAIPNPNEY